MAESVVHLSLRLRDLDRYRLFVWELQQLADDMRVGASPFTERLESAIERFVDGGDDEAPDGHLHDLPDVDGPRIPVEYEDGCRADPNDDGSWTMTTLDVS